MPELAYETVRLEIDMGDCPYHADDFHLAVAKRDEMCGDHQSVADFADAAEKTLASYRL